MLSKILDLIQTFEFEREIDNQKYIFVYDIQYIFIIDFQMK